MTHDRVAQALAWIQGQAAAGNFHVTQHAAVEMDEEDILLGDVLEAIAAGEVLENYPEHRRGACCLLSGMTNTGRPLHAVCTTSGATFILITVYEPMLPKWKSPTKRNR